MSHNESSIWNHYTGKWEKVKTRCCPTCFMPSDIFTSVCPDTFHISVKCSKCGGSFNPTNGHVFSDYKTMACKDCMSGFEAWRKSRKSNIIEVRCKVCNTIANPIPSRARPFCNGIIKPSNVSLKCNSYIDYKLEVGKNYRFSDGVYSFTSNKTWSWNKESS